MSTVEELRTLVDPTQSNPALPSGHPFSNVQSDATGRLLPMSSVLLALLSCTSTLVKRAASVRPTTHTYGVYEADMDMMLIDFVI